MTWLITGIVATAPLWLVLGFTGLLLGLLGPFAILLFKPGENVLGKLALAILVASPTAIGLSLLVWKWSQLSAKWRVLSIIGLSALWHAPGALLWLMILTGLN